MFGDQINKLPAIAVHWHYTRHVCHMQVNWYQVYVCMYVCVCVCAASLGGDSKLVHLLVENGADVNKKDIDGNSILMVRVRLGEQS